jgi:hypothetical protein
MVNEHAAGLWIELKMDRVEEVNMGLVHVVVNKVSMPVLTVFLRHCPAQLYNISDILYEVGWQQMAVDSRRT